ncbi:hypothetical protein [Arthrobacter oryzae]|uniref:Uncharacterized protein n=1 Tax=Arthrobacter oryzae TaxID=409290 RepID=A0A3N0BX51_9MICC|nr:hypothetical protein [Arthrobacter oryzae]RNL53891.1 hypothetical protein D7003_12275 [Arthrobacter oryzae]
MSSLQDVLTGYSLRARLYPALLVALPVVALILITWDPQNLEAFWPLFASLGVPFLTSSVVRSRGKKLERSLLVRWERFPTTRLLRADDSGNPTIRERRREQLTALTGQPLPSEDEELKDSPSADQRYEAAVRTLIARTHGGQQDHYLLGEENASYGFRRNLLALKPVALIVLVVCLGVDGMLVPNANGSLRPLAALGLHLVLAGVWLLVIRPPWVLEAAEDYAKSLYDGLERLSQRN